MKAAAKTAKTAPAAKTTPAQKPAKGKLPPGLAAYQANKKKGAK